MKLTEVASVKVLANQPGSAYGTSLWFELSPLENKHAENMLQSLLQNNKPTISKRAEAILASDEEYSLPLVIKAAGNKYALYRKNGAHFRVGAASTMGPSDYSRPDYDSKNAILDWLATF